MKIPNNNENLTITLTINNKEKHKPKEDALVSIKRVYVRKEEIEIKFEADDTNRMIKKYGEDRFCLVNFDDGVEGIYIQKVLLNGITIINERYCFMGHSSSQIKERYAKMVCLVVFLIY